MLEIESLYLRNFFSYGDYETKLALGGLGPCLISGEVIDAAGEDSRKASNGAGKTALVESILWCLFGRTMRIPNPGDKVINHFVGRGCIVELTFKNGDKLRRTRNVDGHNDLLLTKDGQDVSLGTTTMEQERLNHLLGLDFDLFTGSTFFSQFGRSWMEISDLKRKEALEREFRLDKIQTYASAAKSRLDRVKQEQDRTNIQLDALGSQLASVKAQIDRFKQASAKFDEQKQQRIQHAQQLLNESIQARDSLDPPDIAAVQRWWDLYEKADGKLNEKQQRVHELIRQRQRLEIDADHQRALIKKWENKGEVCGACERVIPPDHVAKKLETPRTRLGQINKELRAITTKATQQQAEVDRLRAALEAKRPKITVAQAEAAHREKARYQNQIGQHQKTLNQIAAESNEYAQTIVGLRAEAKELGAQIETAKNRLAKFDKLILHLNYVHRAYHDRRKIKAHLLAEYIPYLNSRIKYYLTKFDLDLTIEFTSALGVTADLWGYQQFSGGECKRFDVAMMLAMFDLHALMYGRHCNLIVFDEVDGRLDVNGAEVFADIIRSDFADKVDTLLVISQRLDMRDALPSEVRVVREGRQSRIAEVRI